MKKKRAIAIIVFLICILFVIALVYICLNFDVIKTNYKILNSKQPVISLDKTNLKLWKRTLKSISKKDAQIELNVNDSIIVLNNDYLEPNRTMNFDLEFNKIESNYTGLENIQCVEIRIKNEDCKKYISSVKINKLKEWKNHSKVDMYAINNNTAEKILTVENSNKDNYLEINLQDHINHVLLCYIPITSIEAQNENIELNKGQTAKIGVSVIPKNATNKNIKVTYDESIITLDKFGIITANEVGEGIITIQNLEDNVKKEINIKINAIAEEILTNIENITITEGEKYQVNASVSPGDAVNNQLDYKVSDENIISINEKGLITAKRNGEAIVYITTLEEPIIQKEIKVTVNKKIEVINVENVESEETTYVIGKYINGILLVNKKYELPSNYNPGINSIALEKFNEMKSKAAEENVNLKIVSGFRSYDIQKEVYNKNVRLYGEEVANTFSAKPGQSEHQTGLAFDVNSTQWAFGNTAEGIWLAEHCYEFGFIIRYPKDKQEITGYVYEPWHIRYIGVEHSLKIKETGQCLEEYLGVN